MEVSRFMPKTRLIMMSVLAVFAIGAASASTASAAFELSTAECSPATIATFCWVATAGEALLELKGSEPFSIEVHGQALLEVASLELHIVCTAITNVVAGATTGELTQPEPLVKAGNIRKLQLVFTACSVLGLEAKCKVKEPIQTNPLEGNIEGTPLEDVTFKPEGTEFTKIVIESKTGQTCPATLTSINGKVTGTALCLAPNSEVDEATKEITCRHTETTGLLFAEKPATFEIEEGEVVGTGSVLVKPTNIGTDLWDWALG